jgi:ABC-2 type transport system ATP-binding protein
MEAIHGRRTFDVRLRDIHLGEGDYHVHGALAHWNGATFNQLTDAASLTMEGEGRSIGPVGVREVTATAVEDALVSQAS